MAAPTASRGGAPWLRRFGVWVAAASSVGLFALGVRRLGRASRPPAPAPVSVVDVLGAAPSNAALFARVTGPAPIELPVDEGPHPAYRTEWWYYTGNLEAPNAGPGAVRRFGFELTFFRQAMAPTSIERASAWATSQVFLSHFALTDVASSRFDSFERSERQALGMAGARGSPFRVWLDDWWAAEAPATDGAVATGADVAGARALHAAAGGRAIDLRLEALKPIVLHGDRGVSRKGPEPGNASRYYSSSRLRATGTVTATDGTWSVAGLAWMDHEWSTSALARGTVGWDWFGLQLSDDSEIMLYRLRDERGATAPESGGSLVGADGSVTTLAPQDIHIEVADTWRSPRSGVVYPSVWRLEVARAQVALEVTPLLRDQELDLSVRYWEGAVGIRGRSAGGPVTGSGYAELTGYGP